MTFDSPCNLEFSKATLINLLAYAQSVKGSAETLSREISDAREALSTIDGNISRIDESMSSIAKSLDNIGSPLYDVLAEWQHSQQRDDIHYARLNIAAVGQAVSRLTLPLWIIAVALAYTAWKHAGL